jgi:hypothetical protein
MSGKGIDCTSRRGGLLWAKTVAAQKTINVAPQHRKNLFIFSLLQVRLSFCDQQSPDLRFQQSHKLSNEPECHLKTNLENALYLFLTFDQLKMLSQTRFKKSKEIFPNAEAEI